MADTPLIDANPTHYLTRVDRDTPPYQFVRELVQNGVEAEATRIEISPYPYEYEVSSTGEIKVAQKFLITDNGEGMTADFMFRHLAMMNSSSKASNSGCHENFGIGAKITTAMWNPYGVVFASWSKDAPDKGHLVWLHKSFCQGKEQICLKGFDDSEGYPITTEINGYGEQNIIPLSYVCDDGEVVSPKWGGVDWESLKPPAGHGTVVLLLGDDPSSSTWTTSEKSPLTGRSLMYYLNTRYATLPENLQLMVYRSNSFNQVKGFNQIMDSTPDDYVQSREVVVCPGGFKVEVLITKEHNSWAEEYKAKRGLTGNSTPFGDGLEIASLEDGFVVCQYDTDHTSEFYNLERGKRAARQWGLGSDAVIKKVKIIVHPPKSDDAMMISGVYPNEGRYLLQWKEFSTTRDTNALDLSKVQAYFKDNMPPKLSALIEESFSAYKSKGSNIDTQLNKYKDIFKPKKAKKDAVVEDASGGINFNPQGQNNPSKKKPGDGSGNGSNHGSSKRSKSGEANAKGTHTGVRKKARVRKQVEFYWHNFDESSDTNAHTGFLTDGQVYPFDLSQNNHIIRVQGNKDHPIFNQIVDHFKNAYRSLPKSVILDVVTKNYEGWIKAYIIHVLELVKGSDFNNYVTQKVLYAKCLGNYKLWDKIASELGTTKYNGK